MVAATDFHTHILPGIDDGSSCVEESLAMLRMEAEQGIGRVLATPHFYPRYETPDSFLTKREQAQKVLREAMVGQPDLPELEVGAEVYYFRGISEMDCLKDLAIVGTDYILIEMPMAPWQDTFFRELIQIRERRGLIPVIAHIDRYITPLRTFGIPRKLEELPVLVQANASFFLKGSTSSMAMKMLRSDQIHLLGSDCHNLDSRKPNLGEARSRIEHKLGPTVLQRLSKYENLIFEPNIRNGVLL